MSTIYKINRLCKINTNNPTPCKDDMDVAINIVPVDKNKEFENFVLGINNVQQCFECFGCGCTLGYDFNVEKFVESIEIDVTIPFGLVDSDEGEYDGIFCDEQHVFCIKINIRNEEPIYTWVYNKHNGFYCHSVYYTNNTLKVDCWEQDCL